MNATVVIGLVGGVGAGKSTVATAFARHGAVVLDADRFVAEAWATPAVQQAVRGRFGADVLTADGLPDRRVLADRVFADPAERQALEAILHPPVRERIAAGIADARAADAPAVVLDVPLLVGSPLEAHVDIGVFVDAPLEVRERRCQAARGWPAGEVARRDAAQPPLEEKRARCEYVVLNDDTRGPTDVERQVAGLWNEITAAGRSPQRRDRPAATARPPTGKPPAPDRQTD